MATWSVSPVIRPARSPGSPPADACGSAPPAGRPARPGRRRRAPPPHSRARAARSRPAATPSGASHPRERCRGCARPPGACSGGCGRREQVASRPAADRIGRAWRTRPPRTRRPPPPAQWLPRIRMPRRRDGRRSPSGCERPDVRGSAARSRTRPAGYQPRPRPRGRWRRAPLSRPSVTGRRAAGDRRTIHEGGVTRRGDGPFHLLERQDLPAQQHGDLVAEIGAQHLRPIGREGEPAPRGRPGRA